MGFRTIVAAADSELRALYQQQVNDLGVECDAVASIQEMFECLKNIPYNGLLIDLATLVKADRIEKAQCHELLRLFPTLRLRWDDDSQKLLCLLYGNRTSDDMTLQIFIDEHCRPFKGRKIRRHNRLELHYNTQISRSGDFTENDLEQTTTLDISEGGSLIVSSQEWAIGETLWLRFIEFEDLTPIKATICRWTPWGTPMQFPSIGVCFTELSDAQLSQIKHPGKAIYEKKQLKD